MDISITVFLWSKRLGGFDLSKQQSEKQAKISKIGFDNLLEDIFGLNIRAMKTISVLFRKPFDYFKAARTPEWEDKYTPSFRVWFGILALLVALNFIYNNDKSVMTEAYEGMMEQLAIQIEQTHNAANERAGKPPDIVEIDTKSAARDMGKWAMVYYPFAYIPFMALAGIFIRFWGQHLSYVTRLRYLFAVVIPGTTFMFLSTFLVLVISAAHFAWLTAVMFFVIVTLDFITSFRGPFKEMPRAKRIWRSIALTVILFFVYVLGSVTATFPAMIKTMGDNVTINGEPIKRGDKTTTRSPASPEVKVPNTTSQNQQ